MVVKVHIDPAASDASAGVLGDVDVVVDLDFRSVGDNAGIHRDGDSSLGDGAN